jgi:hypothetical protein
MCGPSADDSEHTLPRLSVDDQTVVSTSIVSLRLTIFLFSAEEIQIVATEDLSMNAQIRRTEPYPGIFKRVHSSTIETSKNHQQFKSYNPTK